MAAVSTEDESGKVKNGYIEIREGDWKAYLLHSKKRHDEATLTAMYSNVGAYKTACALAYLGRRAQVRGGVCSLMRPHILTPQLVAGLEANNKMHRYNRYPWLESLMIVLAEIERSQEEICNSSNVISMLAPGRS